jgi:hypothetical protein
VSTCVGCQPEIVSVVMPATLAPHRRPGWRLHDAKAARGPRFPRMLLCERISE